MKLVSLNNVAEVIRGVTFSKADGSSDKKEGMLPVIRAGSIQKSLLLDIGNIWIPAEKVRAHQLIRKNDIVMCTSSGSSDLVGKCAKSELDWNGSFGAFCAGIRANELKCNSSYLYHFLCSPDFRNWSKGSEGANIKNIRISELADFKIPLPPLNEQKRIAAILDKADSLRRKRQQAIQLTDQFLRSVFLDLFGDPMMNPKGWDVKAWSSCLNIVNGKNQKQVEVENGEFPICGSGGEMGRASDWLTKANSVIIGRKGNINHPILMKENFWNVDTAFGLEPHQNLLSHNYLFWFCKFFDFERLNKAVTIPSLTKADLLQIEMPLPDYYKQQGFDLIVEKVALQVEKQHQSKDFPIFDSLSQKAFSGDL